jgi:recombination protein RecA
VVKNKVAAPFKQAEFDIEYGTGISREGSLIDMGLEQDLVQKSGSFFSYGDVKLGQGRANSKQFLAENDELSSELERRILDAVGITRGESVIIEAEEETPGEAQAA